MKDSFYKHASFFSGIGGFDYAAEGVGYENCFFVEWDEFCRRVLSYYWPNLKLYKDVTKEDFTGWRNRILVLSGGFPCQPFSQAGSRKGENDNRYLWPEMLRGLQEVRPPWFIGENVAGLTSMVFGSDVVGVESQATLIGEEVERRMGSEGILVRIIEDLESIGYSVETFLIPACSKDAPHRRDRVWLVAYNAGYEEEYVAAYSTCNNQCNDGKFKSEREGSVRRSCSGSCGVRAATDSSSPRARVEESNTGRQEREPTDSPEPKVLRQGDGEGNAKGVTESIYVRDATYSDSEGLEGFTEQGEHIVEGEGSRKRQPDELFRSVWQDFPTEPPLRVGDDGVSGGLDGITFSKLRKESLKAAGNAIVPQVAAEILSSIYEGYKAFRVIKK